MTQTEHDSLQPRDMLKSPLSSDPKYTGAIFACPQLTRRRRAYSIPTRPGAGGDQWTDELRYLITTAVEAKRRPSVGIGVRRESALGPHLGGGIGGQWLLTGDLEADRSAIIDTLEAITEWVRAGKVDELLIVDPDAPADR